jgi:hypothetical protein
MNAIIQAQGAKPFDHNQPGLGALSFEVCATGGIVTSIDNLQLARIAGRAGAPKVKCAGVDLATQAGRRGAAGPVLYRVHASFAATWNLRARPATSPAATHWPTATTSVACFCGVLMHPSTPVLLLCFDENLTSALLTRLAHAAGIAVTVQRHRFPDGELKLRLPPHIA